VLLSVGGIITYFNQEQADLEKTQLVIRENPAGQKSTFKLSDGTIIKLNAASKLIFPDNFGDHERKVFLEGEAFFNVSRDETKPFIVETSDLSTRVLGTSFNIRSYDDEPEIQVAVVSGKVMVQILDNTGSPENGTDEILLKDQMVSFNSKTKQFNKINGVPDSFLVWQDNTIIFEHTDFKQVQKILARWYGVEFEILTDDSFEGGFVGTYHDEFLDNVLKGLKKQYEKEFEYEIKGKKVIIY
jgi:ferric-dicitrate binding protein FerR (iron transport regulator)